MVNASTSKYSVVFQTPLYKCSPPGNYIRVDHLKLLYPKILREKPPPWTPNTQAPDYLSQVGPVFTSG